MYAAEERPEVELHHREEQKNVLMYLIILYLVSFIDIHYAYRLLVLLRNLNWYQYMCINIGGYR